MLKIGNKQTEAHCLHFFLPFLILLRGTHTFFLSVVLLRVLGRATSWSLSISNFFPLFVN